MSKRIHINEVDEGDYQDLYEGPLPQLPMELIRIIREESAILSVRDSITTRIRDTWFRYRPERLSKDKTGYAKILQEWSVLANAAIAQFWFDFCDWLHENNAVVAGSTCVYALMGEDRDHYWTPKDHDIFMKDELVDKKSLGKLVHIITKALHPNAKRGHPLLVSGKVEKDWLNKGSSMPDLNPENVYYIPAVLAIHNITFDDTYPFIQLIIMGNNGVGTAFYTPEELVKFSINRLLYETFDVKMCASTFNGRKFHIVDWAYTIRGMSRVEPVSVYFTEKHKIDSSPSKLIPVQGMTPLTKRPFVMIKARYDRNIYCSWFALPCFGVSNSGCRVLTAWASKNDLSDTRVTRHAIDRLSKYLGRGLVLALGMHYVKDKREATVSILHRNGVCRSFRKLAEHLDRQRRENVISL